MNETELNKQERDEKRQMGRFIQDQQREEKRQICMNKKKRYETKKEWKNRNKIQPVKMHDNEEEGSLFDDIPTELFGRDKIIVME